MKLETITPTKVIECYSTVGEHGATNDHSIRDYTIDLPYSLYTEDPIVVKTHVETIVGLYRK